MFSGVLKKAITGRFRDYNISKHEWVLDGESVFYANADMIRQTLGFNVNNEPFEKNSWYFRNSLVRANYTNMNTGIYMNTEYLEKFFRNMLLGEKNELKNRYCHIKYSEKVAISEGGQKMASGGQKKWSETTKKIYKLIKENPSVTRKELCDILSINPSAVQKHIEKLKKDGAIIRKDGARGGHWEVL